MAQLLDELKDRDVGGIDERHFWEDEDGGKKFEETAVGKKKFVKSGARSKNEERRFEQSKRHNLQDN